MIARASFGARGETAASIQQKSDGQGRNIGIDVKDPGSRKLAGGNFTGGTSGFCISFALTVQFADEPNSLPAVTKDHPAISENERQDIVVQFDCSRSHPVPSTAAPAPAAATPINFVRSIITKYCNPIFLPATRNELWQSIVSY
jgi:hypothetical protein